ncbi:hypothetical protein GIB67_000684 [Kingdonia uniflora]|uniref:Uncharacterized protein n=1 Tax=Kingdonia uniflora TaxID=39325 RepID=A0A7J7NDM3_9MAGN|nr:hypothetical protein GIB67_000684 [Kingdonia uniflora]
MGCPYFGEEKYYEEKYRDPYAVWEQEFYWELVSLPQSDLTTIKACYAKAGIGFDSIINNYKVVRNEILSLKAFSKSFSPEMPKILTKPIRDNVLTAAAEVEKEIVVLKRCVQHGKIMTYEGLCLHLILRTSYIIQQRLSMPFRSQIRVSASSEIKELALGLELSGQPFLWVVCLNITNSLSEAYPDGFEENRHSREDSRVGTSTKGSGSLFYLLLLKPLRLELNYGGHESGILRSEEVKEKEMFSVDYIGDAAYISCNPHLLHHRLCSSDRFLVLSPDGPYQSAMKRKSDTSAEEQVAVQKMDGTAFLKMDGIAVQKMDDMTDAYSHNNNSHKDEHERF